MPRGDGTGPLGLGPMTGRGAGYCAGYPVPGFMNPMPGYRFWGAGFGAYPYGFTMPWAGFPLFRGYPVGGFWGRGGRGRRNWFYATGMPGWMRAGMGLPAWGWRAPLPRYW